MLHINFLPVIVLPTGNADVTAADGFHPQLCQLTAVLQGNEIQGVGMGIWQLLLGKNDFSGQGSQCLPQHPIGAVTDAGLAQRTIENHPKGICLRVLRPEQLCRPLRSHGVGGAGAFTDFINLTNGFHSAPLLAFIFSYSTMN